MSRDYAKVAPTYWNGDTGRAMKRLGGAHAQLLGQYLLSCPHGTSLGLYRLPIAYVLNDLAMTEEEILAAFVAVEAAGFAKYDVEREVVFVVNMAAMQIAEEFAPGDNKMKWVTKEVAKLARMPFFADFVERYREPWGDSLASFEAPPKPLASPSEAPCKPLGRGSDALSRAHDAGAHHAHSGSGSGSGLILSLGMGESATPAPEASPETPRPKPADPMRQSLTARPTVPPDRLGIADVERMFSELRIAGRRGRYTNPAQRDDERLASLAKFANDGGANRIERDAVLRACILGFLGDTTSGPRWPLAFLANDPGGFQAMHEGAGTAPVASPTSDPLSLARAAYAVACERVRASEGTGDYDDAVDAKRAAQRALHTAEAAA